MRLRSVTFSNFRSFYGNQEIEFGINEDDYLTIVHAQNGSGKTNLLNAILWTFYEITTGKFNDPHKILNETARLEGISTAFVEVRFEHLENTYVARRSIRPGSQETIFKINKVEYDGNTVPEHYPQTFIESVIPSEIAKYFFFDGEHAENFAGAANRQNVGRAVRNILGCGVLETAISDLEVEEKRLDKEFKSSLRGQGAEEIVKELEGLEKQIKHLEQQINQSEDIIRTEESQLIDIRVALKDQEKTKKLQEQIERSQARLKRSKQQKQEAENKFIRWADRNALPIISGQLIEVVEKVVAENKQSHRIPEKYAAPVIQELLDEETCICGTSLPEGSSERESVKTLISVAADKDQIDRTTKVQSALVYLKRNMSSSREQFTNSVKQREKAIADISDCEQEIATINKDFQKIDDSEIRQAKNREAEIAESVFRFRNQIQRYKSSLEDLKKEHAAKSRNLSQIEGQQEASKSLKDKLLLVSEAKTYLERELDDYIDKARRVISKNVNDLLQRIAHKPMEIKIKKDFSLDLLYEDGVPLPQSAGEDQLVGIIFTASLINFSKLRANASGDTLVPGTVAPLFLDAPFGQLDDNYQERISEILPELSDQLCLMLSGSQARKEVMDKLEPFGGRQYLIVRHNKADAQNDKEEAISLKGKKYLQTLWGQEKNGSFFELVE